MNYFIGLQVKQTDKRIFINQSKHTRNILNRFGMPDSSTSTPMANAAQSYILLLVVRILCMLLVFVQDSKLIQPRALPRIRPYLVPVKRIFKYFKGTMNTSLWFPNNQTLS